MTLLTAYSLAIGDSPQVFDLLRLGQRVEPVHDELVAGIAALLGSLPLRNPEALQMFGCRCLQGLSTRGSDSAQGAGEVSVARGGLRLHLLDSIRAGRVGTRHCRVVRVSPAVGITGLSHFPILSIRLRPMRAV